MGLNAIYRVTFQQELFQQKIENILHFRSNGVLDDEADLADHFDAFVTASWKDLQTAQVKYKNIKVSRADGGGDLVAEKVPTQPAGALEGFAQPVHVAMVLSIRSNTTNRRKNGRIYISGTTNHAVTEEGRVHATPRAAGTAFGAALMAAFSGLPTLDAYTFGVYSKPMPATETKPAREGLFTAPELIRVSATYGSQRRRNIGIGQ